jgi:RNA polymerase sigma-70 factor (ECF subfamily)
MHPQPGSASGGFLSTHWSIVLAARDHGAPGAQEAMAKLCAAYWRPLYAYVRGKGRSVEDAQDLTQGFFSQLLEKDSLQHVDPAFGKFRSFMLASFKNFLTNEWRHASAAKRGGGAAKFLGLDDMTQAENLYAAAASTTLTPEEIYERNWALALLERTTARLEAEFAAAGKSRVFDSLKQYLTGDKSPGQYLKAATELGISEVSARVSVHRMRGRFRDLLLDETAQTLSGNADPDAVSEELRYLLTVL